MFFICGSCSSFLPIIDCSLYWLYFSLATNHHVYQILVVNINRFGADWDSYNTKEIIPCLTTCTGAYSG